MLGKMINTMFNGSSTQLIMQVLGNQSPSKDELDEIQLLLNKLKKL